MAFTNIKENIYIEKISFSVSEENMFLAKIFEFFWGFDKY